MIIILFIEIIELMDSEKEINTTYSFKEDDENSMTSEANHRQFMKIRSSTRLDH